MSENMHPYFACRIQTTLSTVIINSVNVASKVVFEISPESDVSEITKALCKLNMYTIVSYLGLKKTKQKY